jgi:hypothetical protein
VLATLESSASKKARKRAGLQAARILTREVGGHLQIVDDPPLIVPLPRAITDDRVDEAADQIRGWYVRYRETLPASPRKVLAGYDVVDIGHEVVGVGSVGSASASSCSSRVAPANRCFSRSRRSVIGARGVPRPISIRGAGSPVVEGQRMMQAASDVFLGWSSSAKGAAITIGASCAT